MSEPFSITHQETEASVRAFAPAMRQPFLRRLAAVLIGWAGFAVALAFLYVWLGPLLPLYNETLVSVLFTGAAMGLLASTSGHVARKWYAWRNYASDQAAVAAQLGPSRMDFGPEGIRWSNSRGSGIMYWCDVQEVKELRSGIALLVGHRRYIPLSEEALPEGLSRTDALAHIAEWRKATT